MSEPRDNRKLEAPAAPGGCSLSRVGSYGLWGIVLALAAWARLASWRAVFTKRGIELLPTDTHYYVRFALRLLHAFPRFDGFDPFVNAPGGATIIWPPLHAYAIAGSIALFGPARGPAWVDPFFALVE